MAANSTDAAQQLIRVKALLLALNDLDNRVLDTCRFIISILSDGVGSSYVSEADMVAFADKFGHYREHEFDISSATQYLSKVSESERIWTSMIGLIAVATSNLTVATIKIWKIRLGKIEKSGEQTWKSAVPALGSIYLFAGKEKGDEILNTIIRKLDLLDEILDEDALHEAGVVQRGSTKKNVRFSDELQDTMTAISNWEKEPGALYRPPPTDEYLNEAKAEIRNQRKALQALDTQPRDVTRGKPANVAVAFEDEEHKWDSSITAFICIAILLAIIPGALAWSHSTHEPGTGDDADFFFLIQTSLMQILGLLTLILPVLTQSRQRQQAWYWMWTFVGVSSSFSIVAIPLYLYLPTEWAMTISFLASAAQAFAILQTMFLINRSPDGAAKI